ADCVVAGFRWHKTGKDAVGSLLLGLYDDSGTLQHVGVTSSFTMAMRKQLVKEFTPLRKHALEQHPWREWAQADARRTRMPGGRPGGGAGNRPGGRGARGTWPRPGDAPSSVSAPRARPACAWPARSRSAGTWQRGPGTAAPVGARHAAF